jgi:transposase
MVRFPKYEQHTPEFKRKVVAEYQPGIRGRGAMALAKRFRIKHHSIIQKWVKESNSGNDSLEKKTHSNRKRKLSEKEIDQYVKQVVVKKNKERRHVDYKMVQEAVKRGTGKEIAMRTLRRYGRDVGGITGKQTSRKLDVEGICLFRPSLFVPCTHLSCRICYVIIRYARIQVAM